MSKVRAKAKVKSKKKPAKRKKNNNKDILERKRTIKQEIFCNEWVDSKGNGTYSALVAFDIKGKEILDEERPPKPFSKTIKYLKQWEIYNKYWTERKRIESVANVMAIEYLRKPIILKRIDEILDARGFNDEHNKREHYLLYGEDRGKAVDMYYKVKGKYKDEPEDLKPSSTTIINGLTVKNMSEEDIMEAIKRLTSKK